MHCPVVNSQGFVSSESDWENSDVHLPLDQFHVHDARKFTLKYAALIESRVSSTRIMLVLGYYSMQVKRTMHPYISQLNPAPG